ncbi:MAG: signal peptide peptidase SppA [Hyphomicrobiales bacterium]
MNTDPDYILDRRRMRRKITVWRLVSFIAIGVALVAFFGAIAVSSGTSLKKSSPHIARVPISGFISNSRYAMKQLKQISEDKNVKAVIIAVDSPGGTTVGGEALHNAFREIGTKKPTVSSIGTLAASAGYMVAIASDHIVAPRTSIVGSIGVIMQYPNATKLLDTIGVKMEEIKSSPLKAEPSPFNETPPEARVMLESMLLDTYTWFADLVRKRRGFSENQAVDLLNGSVFTGKQALDNKLIDAIGGEDIAIKWLIEEKKILKDLEIIEWSLSKPQQDFLLARAALNGLLSNFGLSALFDLGENHIAIQQNIHLDGFLSVWQIDQ